MYTATLVKPSRTMTKAADDAATRESRLVLSLSTARTLARGLELLGIPVLERM